MEKDELALISGEFADVFVTLSLCFRFNKGKAKAMKASARLIKKRITRKEVKGILDLFINQPQRSEEFLNNLTLTYYGTPILERGIVGNP